MIRKQCITILFLIASLGVFSSLHADSRPTSESSSGDTSWVDVSLGGFMVSSIVERGARIYDYPFFLAFPSIRLWDGVLSLRGGKGFEVTPRPHANPHVRFSLGFFRDDVLFETFGDQDPIQRSRLFAMEASFGASYQFSRVFSVSGSVSQELIEHHGQYAEVDLAAKPLVFFRRKGPPWMIVELKSGLGLGDTFHNRFMYGPEAEKGLNHYFVRMRVVCPALLWGATPIFGISYTEMLGAGNRRGSLLQGNLKNITGMFVLSYRLSK